MEAVANKKPTAPKARVQHLAETSMQKKLFYLLVKPRRFLIQESDGEFNKDTIAALKESGWSVYGSYSSKRQAKDEAYQRLGGVQAADIRENRVG